MWNIGDIQLQSRFMLGSAAYPSLDLFQQAAIAAETEVITVSLTRAKLNTQANQFFNLLQELDCHLLPNTAGCYSANEAVATAHLARELFVTNWIKLEVIGDDTSLQPNCLELLRATEKLIQAGFCVFPYCTDDLIICQELVAMGCEVLMPLAAPIGSGKGLLNPYNLTVLRQRFPKVKLIVDAGIGRPDHAAAAMQLGFDGVLLNSAVSQAVNPVQMASAFKLAIQAGRLAYEAGMMPERNFAVASTAYANRPFQDETVC